MPTYFTSEVGVNLMPFKYIFTSGMFTPFFLKYIISVLAEFKDILFARSQLLSDFKSVFTFLAMFLFRWLLRLIICSRLVSSAKCLVVEKLMDLCRSLMYTRNNKGPRIEPCGTPCSITFRSESELLIDTYCFLLERYDWNHLFEIPRIP